MTTIQVESRSKNLDGLEWTRWLAHNMNDDTAVGMLLGYGWDKITLTGEMYKIQYRKVK